MAGRPAEETPRFRNFKSGKAGGLEKSRLAVGYFDQLFQFRRRFGRQAEAPMNSREQALLDHLVGVADHRLERRNHVADDVLGCVVQQDREAAAVVELRRTCARQRFDQKRMLRHGEDMRAAASGRSSARRARARARYPRSRCRAPRDRGGRAAAQTAFAARRAATAWIVLLPCREQASLLPIVRKRVSFSSPFRGGNATPPPSCPRAAWWRCRRPRAAS